MLTRLSSDVPLPDFTNPPVIETVLSVQFEPISNLQVPQIGILWERFRESYPYTEQHPPLDPSFEYFDVKPTKARAKLEVLNSFPVPRCWFLNESRSELVQIQSDRIVHNWRKIGEGDKYPRYERSIRPQFLSELKTFKHFLELENLGEFRPNQCEVTYINHIQIEDQTHSNLGEILSGWNPQYSDHFLSDSQIENARFNAQWVYGEEPDTPMGRLYIAAEPVFLSKTGEPVVRVTLTTRGAPEGDGIDGVLPALDRGREMIVRGFSSITTDKMHKRWS